MWISVTNIINFYLTFFFVIKVTKETNKNIIKESELIILIKFLTNGSINNKRLLL